jgi:hypothetical protein
MTLGAFTLSNDMVNRMNWLTRYASMFAGVRLMAQPLSTMSLASDCSGAFLDGHYSCLDRLSTHDFHSTVSCQKALVRYGGLDLGDCRSSLAYQSHSNLVLF